MNDAEMNLEKVHALLTKPDSGVSAPFHCVIVVSFSVRKKCDSLCVFPNIFRGETYDISTIIVSLASIN